MVRGRWAANTACRQLDTANLGPMSSRGQGSQSRVRAAPKLHGDDYFTLSRQPLHVLVVLLPLVAIYEVLSLQYLFNPDTKIQQVIKAENLIGRAFEVFGVTGLLVPAMVMLTVLLAWHIVRKDRWTVRPPYLLAMVAESVLWALPLVVLGAIVLRLAAQIGPAPAAAVGTPEGVLHAATGLLAQTTGGSAGSGQAAPAAGSLASLPWQARLSISLGAGLYEELVFRLIGIAAIHLVLKDILRWNERLCDVLAVVGSALAFALYHDSVYAAGSGLAAIRWSDLTFFFLAGVYFAILYLSRGFGIVVLCHAAYDCIVLLQK